MALGRNKVTSKMLVSHMGLNMMSGLGSLRLVSGRSKMMAMGRNIL